MKTAVYESPQAELLEITQEVNFLTSFEQNQGIPNLEEEDGWGDDIWG